MQTDFLSIPDSIRHRLDPISSQNTFHLY